MGADKNTANYLFEVGMLAMAPRSFVHLLGTGRQTVAEHVHRVIHIGFVLAMMHKEADMEKVLKMCLLHDITETRISDLNYVHQKYTEKNEEKALKELTETVPFGDEIRSVIEEYEERKTLEARLAKDADQLELIIFLKEQLDLGNSRAATWLPASVKRLKTEAAQQLAEKILETNSDDWWYGDKDDEWWVSRNKK